MPLELDDRGRALENEYFRNKEREILEKMKAKIESEETKNLELQCPKCDGTLHATDFESIKIDVCDTCHGVGSTRANSRRSRTRTKAVGSAEFSVK